MINMTNLRQWERQMKMKRQGRTWIESPPQEIQNIPCIKLRPLGNCLSSTQYIQPFMIWATIKIQERFGIDY